MEYNKKVKPACRQARAERRKLKGFLSPFRGLGLLLCFGLLAFSLQSVKAQTFDEWFAQSKTQIKYLEQQIVALNACEVQFRQGYGMLKSEWGSIKNWKNSEYNLHQTYYNSLSQVNPQVKNSTDMSGIQSEEQSIISQFNGLNGLTGLTAQEQTYIGTVQQNLLAELNKDLTELQTVVTPGQMVMSDDERIKQINKMTAAIDDKYQFTCTFCRQVRVMVIQRNSDANDATEIGNLYDVNP